MQSPAARLGDSRTQRAAAQALAAQSDAIGAYFDLAAVNDAVHALPGRALLVSAQAALEAFSEALEGVLRTTEGDLFAEVEKALASVFLARFSSCSARRRS